VPPFVVFFAAVFLAAAFLAGAAFFATGAAVVAAVSVLTVLVITSRGFGLFDLRPGFLLGAEPCGSKIKVM
jgi:hypothetical protein